MKHFFIINPHSFKYAEEMNKVIAECESAASQADCSIYISRTRRDAVAVVYRHLSDIPADETVRVYAIGGDGILFDCLNGLIDFPNAELTSVPHGYANDFIRAFGEDAKPAFRDIKKLSVSPSRPVDILCGGANYAINGVNIGIGGQTTLYANAILRSSHKKWFNKFIPKVYTFSALRALFDKDVREQKYTIYMDGEDVSDAYANIHIANGPCNGGSMIPSPYAVPDDGWLDVITLQATHIPGFVKTVRDYERGRFENSKNTHKYRRCKVIEVQSENPFYIEMDGEAFMADEMKFEVAPKGIKFFAPEGIWFADYSYMTHNGGKGGSEV